MSNSDVTLPALRPLQHSTQRKEQNVRKGPVTVRVTLTYGKISDCSFHRLKASKLKSVVRKYTGVGAGGETRTAEPQFRIHCILCQSRSQKRQNTQASTLVKFGHFFGEGCYTVEIGNRFSAVNTQCVSLATAGSAGSAGCSAACAHMPRVKSHFFPLWWWWWWDIVGQRRLDDIQTGREPLFHVFSCTPAKNSKMDDTPEGPNRWICCTISVCNSSETVCGTLLRDA